MRDSSHDMFDSLFQFVSRLLQSTVATIERMHPMAMILAMIDGVHQMS